jgi:hypothetical protein
VNINTCPFPVLLALGLHPSTADKVLDYRKGKDGEEGTVDDGIFDTPSQIVPVLSAQSGLAPAEKALLTQLSETALTVESRYFMVKGVSGFPGRKEKGECACIVGWDGKIYYWRQS